MVKGKHLRYCFYAAFDSGENRHAQLVMKELGITYQHATPQSIADQWWFWNCEGVPEELPEFLSPLDEDPFECIGLGLSQQDAEKISNYSKE